MSPIVRETERGDIYYLKDFAEWAQEHDGQPCPDAPGWVYDGTFDKHVLDVLQEIYGENGYIRPLRPAGARRSLYAYKSRRQMRDWEQKFPGRHVCMIEFNHSETYAHFAGPVMLSDIFDRQYQDDPSNLVKEYWSLMDRHQEERAGMKLNAYTMLTGRTQDDMPLRYP